MNTTNIVLLVFFILCSVGGLLLGGTNGVLAVLAGILIPLGVKVVQKFMSERQGTNIVEEGFEPESLQQESTQTVGQPAFDSLFEPSTEPLNETFSITEFKRNFPYLSDPKTLTHLSMRVPHFLSPELSIKVRDELNRLSELMVMGPRRHPSKKNNKKTRRNKYSNRSNKRRRR